MLGNHKPDGTANEEWLKVPPSTIQNVIGSWMKRSEAVIFAKGGSKKCCCNFSGRVPKYESVRLLYDILN